MARGEDVGPAVHAIAVGLSRLEALGDGLRWYQPSRLPWGQVLGQGSLSSADGGQILLRGEAKVETAGTLDRYSIEHLAHPTSLSLPLDVVTVNGFTGPGRTSHAPAHRTLVGVKVNGVAAHDLEARLAPGRVGEQTDSDGRGLAQPPVGGEGHWLAGGGAGHGARPEVGEDAFTGPPGEVGCQLLLDSLRPDLPPFADVIDQ